MTARAHQRSKAWFSLGAALLALLAAVSLSSVGSADTTATPDTTTRGVLNPNPSTGCDPVPPNQAAAPCATNSNGTAAGNSATFTGANGGDKLSIHVDGSAGTFFGVTRTALCRGSLTDVQLSAQVLPSNGDCIPGGGLANGEPGNGNHAAGGSSPPNTYVDYTFKVGEGTYTPPGGTAITCDGNNPCTVWLQESVSNADDTSGYIFKHFTIQYAGGSGGTTTTTTHASTTSTTTSGSTTTTTHASTTSTTTGGSTTSTTSGSTTTTGATGPTTTTSTTVPAGTGVSPSTAAPGAPFTITSNGWMPCSASPTSSTTSTSCSSVTVVFESSPITLGALTPDGTGTVTGQFNVPTGAAAGSHTIVLAGTGADDSPRTVRVGFTVTGGSASGSGGGASSGVGGSSTGSGPLALTGADLTRALWFADACFLAGMILVGASRRYRPEFDR